MMLVMFHRVLVAAAIAVPALGVAPVALADPTQCPASGCPHGPANTAPGTAAPPAPPAANVNSPSYKDGYKSEHDYFAIPQNHAYLASEMKSGYTAASACEVEVKGGSAPPNLNDWLAGCVDALHDLGFKP
jgi:glucose/arabinose dehydrogenase